MGDLINPWDIFWTIFNFTVFVGILSVVFYKPVLKMLDQRREDVANSLEEARRAREEAAQLRQEYDRKLAETQREAQALLERAEARAKEERDQLLAQARAEAEAVISKARETIERERDQAIAALRAEAADLAIYAAERIINKELDPELHRQLAEEALVKVGRA